MHRVSASPGTDDALAAELIDAGEAEVERGRLRAAVELLLLASRVAGDVDVREAALLRAVDCLGVAGDVPRAQSLRDEVAACRASPRRSFVLATLTASAGRLAEALARAHRVTERPGVRRASRAARARALLARHRLAYAGQGEEATTWAERALAGDPPSPTVLVTARQARALGLAITGRAREAVAELGDLSPSHPVPEPFEAELMATRGGIRALSGDLAGAVEDLVAVVGWARAGSLPRSLANAYASLADVEYRLGRWDDGLTHADIAISVAEDGNQTVGAGRRACRGERLPRRPRRVGARRGAPRPCSRRLATVALPLSVFFTSLGAARLAALRGDWEAVVAALATFRARGPGDASTTLGQRVWELRRRGVAGARPPRGRRAAARALGPGGLRGGGPGDAGRRMAAARRARRGARRHGRGGRRVRRRGGGGRDVGLRSRLAGASRSPTACSCAGHAAGRAAAERLGAARERFERLGARPWLERCDAELAACGVRTGGRVRRDVRAHRP